MNSRGISPLIATVLLIAFSVALGAVVMNWGQDFVKKQADKVDKDSDIQLKCSQDVSLDILEIDNVKKACYRTGASVGNVTILVENTGTENVTGIQIVLLESDDTITTETSSLDIISGQAQKYFVSYTGTGTITHIEIAPIIHIPGSTKTTICGGNRLILDEIEACT